MAEVLPFGGVGAVKGESGGEGEGAGEVGKGNPGMTLQSVRESSLRLGMSNQPCPA